MYGGWRLGVGFAGGLVLCLAAMIGWIPVTVVAGLLVATVVGAVAGAPAANRTNAAIDGGWAGGLAAGVAWIGVLGPDVAIRASQAVIDAAAAAAPMNAELGAQILGESVLDVCTAVPLAFWAWIGGGAAVGAFGAVVVGGWGRSVAPRLPATFSPMLVLIGSAMTLLINAVALGLVSGNLRQAQPDGQVDQMLLVQVGGAFAGLVLAVVWSGWCAGARLRNRVPAVWATGVILVVLALASLGLLAAMAPLAGSSTTAVLAGLALLIGAGATGLGYLHASGLEPLPTAMDGAGEILHGVLLATILVYGTGGTCGMGLTPVLSQINGLTGQVSWSQVPPIAEAIFELRWQHPLFCLAALPGLLTHAVFVFPSIVIQRRLGE